MYQNLSQLVGNPRIFQFWNFFLHFTLDETGVLFLGHPVLNYLTTVGFTERIGQGKSGLEKLDKLQRQDAV